MANLPPHMDQRFQNAQLPGKSPFQRQGANQFGPTVKRITQGSLVYFSYANYKHDPYPLIIVTDIFKNSIRGVNLHYLTFQYIKNLLHRHCDNMMFSYFNIKQDQYITDAFRTYKRLGIQKLRKLDCKFLLNVLGSVTSFDPAEVEQMRVYVREQLQRQVTPRANEMTQEYMRMQRQQPGNNGGQV